MLSVLIYCGVRFQELLDIKVQDVSLDTKTLLIANGKGGKSRLLYPTKECLLSLSEWLIVRARMKPKHEWLFAYDIGRRMGELGTRQMLQDTKARAGLADHRNIQPHACRRAYATRCLERGMDIRSLQASLGHSDAATTLIYTFAAERPAQAMQKLAGLDAPKAETKSNPSDKSHARSVRRKSLARRSGRQED